MHRTLHCFFFNHFPAQLCLQVGDGKALGEGSTNDLLKTCTHTDRHWQLVTPRVQLNIVVHECPPCDAQKEDAFDQTRQNPSKINLYYMYLRHCVRSRRSALHSTAPSSFHKKPAPCLAIHVLRDARTMGLYGSQTIEHTEATEKICMNV